MGSIQLYLGIISLLIITCGGFVSIEDTSEAAEAADPVNEVIDDESLMCSAKLADCKVSKDGLMKSLDTFVDELETQVLKVFDI